MGMYTEMKLDIVLKPLDQLQVKDGEFTIHELLTKLFNEEDYGSDQKSDFGFPEHPFWSEKRFANIGYGGYTDEDGDIESPDYDHPLLKIRCDINHGSVTIHKFLDWITPYVDSIQETGEYANEYDRERYIYSTDVDWRRNDQGKEQFCLVHHVTDDRGWKGTHHSEQIEWIPSYSQSNTVNN